MPTNIRAVIFDFGNVLGIFDHMKACGAISRKSPGLSAERVFEISRRSLFRKHEDGSLKPQEFFAAISKRTQYTDTFENFKKDWSDIFTEVPDMVPLVGKIHPRIRKVVLSNTDPLNWNYASRLPVMKEHFEDPERLVLSYEVRARKPSEKIFREALKRGRCTPDEAVYFDDIEEYVLAAKSLGINAHIFNAKDHPTSVMETLLASYDILT